MSLFYSAGLGGGAIPDPVVSLYEFEDDSNTSTAVDSEGSNDLNINGATYSSTAAVGSLALSHDGSGNDAVSQNTADLSAAGDTDGIGLSAWLYFPSGVDGGSTTYAAGWGADTNNFLQLLNRNGNLGSFFQVGGSNDIIEGPSISADTFYHAYAEVLADGTHRLVVDDTEEATSNSGLDPANIGSGEFRTGSRVGDGTSNAQVIVDDFAPASDPLTDSELQFMIDRAN